MRYSIGDYVVIKDNLNTETLYYNADFKYGDTASYEMKEYRGRKAKIVDFHEFTDSYILDIDNGKWAWTDGMFKAGYIFCSPFQKWENMIKNDGGSLLESSS